MEFACTNCKKRLRVADEHAGKSIQCPACRTALDAPMFVAKPVAPPPTANSKKSSRAHSTVPAARVAPAAAAKAGGDSRPQPAPAPSDPFLFSDTNTSMAPAPNWNSAPAPAPRSGRRRTRSPKPLYWILGGLAGLFIVLVVGAVLLISRWAQPNTTDGNDVASTSAPSGSTRVFSGLAQLPVFPDLPPAQAIGEVDYRFVDLAHSNRSNIPGWETKLRVYLPRDAQSPQSIPLMLVAPAGTPLFHGNEVDSGDYHDETLPYAQAGMAVIMYSLDGFMVDRESVSDARYVQELSRAYTQFKSAEGGVANAQVAIGFALAKLPQVDPKRIYCAGHSSAATVSLLLAMKDQRIAAGIAYAPVANLETRLAEAIADRDFRRILPGIEDFARDNSPIQFVGRARCPLFIFHAQDDSNEPYEGSEQLVEQLKSHGKQVTFSSVPRGDHYQPMIDQGIPRAIQWLEAEQPALR